jgi:hypothetical protein
MPTLSTQVFNLSQPGVQFSDSETWTVLPGIIAQSSGNSGAYSQYDHSELVNYGAIISSAPNRDGVEFYGDDCIITNKLSGLILGDHDGVYVDGDTQTIDNAGLISGKHGSGVEFWWDAKFVTVKNTGTISGGVAGITANSDHDGGYINNHGVIHGGSYGILVNTGGVLLTTIENYGTIEGGDAIRTKVGGVHLENHGTLTGGLRLASTVQTDEVINSGKIVGNVLLGEGDDFFDGTGGTSGGIFGQAGNDHLIGGSSGEKIDGGLGKDVMSGAGGADRFDFNKVADSRFGAMHDVITFFNHSAHDRIDLADIFGGTLDFIGTGAFTGAGQLRYVLQDNAGTSNDRTMIYVSVDGYGAPDFEIQVNTLVHFVAGDFVL